MSLAPLRFPLALILSSHRHADPISSPHDLSPREASSTWCIWQMTAPSRQQTGPERGLLLARLALREA